MAIERVIGVDFGTSTSVMRVKRYENGKPVGSGSRLDVQGISEKSMDHIPTLVQSCGTENRYFGTDAKVPKGRDHEIHSNFKLELESADSEKRAKARMLTRDFLGYMGKRYKAMKEGSVLFEADTERTIVSYPVKWNEQTRKFMLEAAADAGFPNVEGMDEAEAAIHAAIIQHEDMLREKGYLKEGMPAVILLIDMGAGTTDMVLCRYVPGKQPQKQVLATWPEQGDVLFGGAEVDSLLRQYAKGLFLSEEDAEDCLKRISLDQFKEWKEGNVSPELGENRSVNYFQKLMEKAEDRDIELKPFSLDRQSFESLAEGYLRQFPELLTGCLKKAGITGSQVDLVILTGGHSQWYFVKEMLAGKMPHICPALLPQISHDHGRIIQMAEPQATAALGMVYSPMTANLSRNDKQEQPRQEPQNSTQSYRPAESTYRTGACVTDRQPKRTEFQQNDGIKIDRPCVPKDLYISNDPNDPQFTVLKSNGSIWSNALFNGMEINKSPKWNGITSFAKYKYSTWVDTAKWIAAIKKDGSVIYSGVPKGSSKSEIGKLDIWQNMSTAYCQDSVIVGLKNDGHALLQSFALGETRTEAVPDEPVTAIEFCGWENIFWLLENGTLNAYGECNNSSIYLRKQVKDWTNIQSIAASNHSIAGLSRDGTVLSANKEYDPTQWDTSQWKDIQCITAGLGHIVGLKKDGTVMASGVDNASWSLIRGWKNIKAIYAESEWTAGLRTDGTVVTTLDAPVQRNVTADWKDIVELYGSPHCIAGVTKTGEIRYVTFKKSFFTNKIKPESVKTGMLVWQKLDTGDPSVWKDYQDAKAGKPYIGTE